MVSEYELVYCPGTMIRSRIFSLEIINCSFLLIVLMGLPKTYGEIIKNLMRDNSMDRGEELLCTAQRARPKPPSSGRAKSFKGYLGIRNVWEHLGSNGRAHLRLFT